MKDGFLTDYFDKAFNRFLLKVFSGFFEFDQVVLKRSNKGGQMASVFTFKLLKEFSLDVIIMLVNLCNSLLSIFFDYLSVLLETKFRSELSILNKISMLP